MKIKDLLEKRNKFLNCTANCLMWALLVIVVVTFVWIIVCAFLQGGGCEIAKRNEACLLFQMPKLIAFFGGCISLWLVTFQLKRQNDVETVRQLGYLRELLNTGNKKKIHFYLLNSHKCGKNGENDRIALLSDIESDSNYIRRPSKEKLDDGDKIRHSNVELFDYLGVLELGAIMLERGLITEEEFNNQFQYRIENIYNSPLRNEIDSPRNSKYYKYMRKHFERINK